MLNEVEQYLVDNGFKQCTTFSNGDSWQRQVIEPFEHWEVTFWKSGLTVIETWTASYAKEGDSYVVFSGKIYNRQALEIIFKAVGIN